VTRFIRDTNFAVFLPALASAVKRVFLQLSQNVFNPYQYPVRNWKKQGFLAQFPPVAAHQNNHFAMM
jgi:hypothetical protein